jgi:hypothetical protein
MIFLKNGLFNFNMRFFKILVLFTNEKLDLEKLIKCVILILGMSFAITRSMIASGIL